MKVNDHRHMVKVKVHNTKCSLDVQGFKDNHTKRFNHLGNKTVGEYFAYVIITEVVQKISKLVDISKLTDHLRILATVGRKAAKAKPTISASCKVCGKDQQKDKTQQCTNCLDYVHSHCLAAKTFKCGNCMVYDVAKVNLPDAVEDIEDLKKTVMIPMEQITPSTSASVVPRQIVDLTGSSDVDHSVPGA